MMKHGTEPDIQASPPVDSGRLPCPFCGSAAQMGITLIGFVTTCSRRRCGANGPMRSTALAADKAWNSRARVSGIKVRKGSRR